MCRTPAENSLPTIGDSSAGAFATKLDSHTSKYFEIPRDHLKKEEATTIQPSNARTDRKH
jgi:hypothetical protein